jgi:hypothetical protein
MNVTELFPSRFLSGTDLNGKRVTVTIEHMALEDVRDPKTGQNKPKPILYFVGAKKPMVLNKTNAVSIAKATGATDTDRWPGKRITLYPTMINSFGADHCVVRVVESAPPPATNGKPAEPPPTETAAAA